MRWNRLSVCALLLYWAGLSAMAQHGEGTAGPVHYRVFDADGNQSSFDAVVEAALDSDVVMVGEEHDDPIAHWLESELLKRLIEGAGERPVALSLEMFERDVQHVVDEYLEGLISETHFKKSGRAWSNYDTDYRPMVETARKADIPVIAANAPRRYVNRVSREGAGSLVDLSPRARSWLSPLPYDAASEEYTAQFNAMMAEQMAEMASAGKEEEEDEVASEDCDCDDTQKPEGVHGEKGPGHGSRMTDSTGASGQMCPHCRTVHEDSTSAGPYRCVGCRHGTGERPSSVDEETPRGMPDDETHRPFRSDADDGATGSPHTMPQSDAGGMHSDMSGMLEAQALWDATMAHSLAALLEREPDAVVMHAVGGFHVEHGTGIPEHLSAYRPSSKQLVVSIRSADDITSFEEKDSGSGDFVILTDASLPRSYERRTD